jgi:hypothetical protein
MTSPSYLYKSQLDPARNAHGPLFPKWRQRCRHHRDGRRRTVNIIHPRHHHHHAMHHVSFDPSTPKPWPVTLHHMVPQHADIFKAFTSRTQNNKITRPPKEPPFSRLASPTLVPDILEWVILHHLLLSRLSSSLSELESRIQDWCRQSRTSPNILRRDEMIRRPVAPIVGVMTRRGFCPRATGRGCWLGPMT